MLNVWDVKKYDLQKYFSSKVKNKMASTRNINLMHIHFGLISTGYYPLAYGCVCLNQRTSLWSSHLLDRRLGGPQSRQASCGGQNIIWTPVVCLVSIKSYIDSHPESLPLQSCLGLNDLIRSRKWVVNRKLWIEFIITWDVLDYIPRAQGSNKFFNILTLVRYNSVVCYKIHKGTSSKGKKR
jgi:hypothetical protein